MILSDRIEPGGPQSSASSNGASIAIDPVSRRKTNPFLPVPGQLDPDDERSQHPAQNKANAHAPNEANASRSDDGDDHETLPLAAKVNAIRRADRTQLPFWQSCTRDASARRPEQLSSRKYSENIDLRYYNVVLRNEPNCHLGRDKEEFHRSSIARRTRRRDRVVHREGDRRTLCIKGKGAAPDSRS